MHGVSAQGGRAGAGARHRGLKQERDLPHLCRAGRAYAAVPEPAATGGTPYVRLDAEEVKVRQDGRVVNVAAVVAVGVRETGEREVLVFDVGAAETYEF